MPRVFSDLNLHGTTAARVQPAVGPWGPAGVPSTRHKWWLRIASVASFVVAFGGLVGLATWIYFRFMKPGAQGQTAAPPADGGSQGLAGLPMWAVVALAVGIPLVLMGVTWLVSRLVRRRRRA